MIVRTTDIAMMIGLISSENEEDAVEKDLDDDIDSMYNVADAGDHGRPKNADDEHSEAGKRTNGKTKDFQGKDYWSRTPPKVAQVRRENIIVGLPGCVDEAKNANTPHDAFSLFISDDILIIILRHTNQKIS
jgi:hypothetical protein